MEHLSPLPLLYGVHVFTAPSVWSAYLHCPFCMGFLSSLPRLYGVPVFTAPSVWVPDFTTPSVWVPDFTTPSVWVPVFTASSVSPKVKGFVCRFSRIL